MLFPNKDAHFICAEKIILVINFASTTMSVIDKVRIIELAMEHN